MRDLLQITSSIIALLGLGGIVGGYATFRLNRSTELEFQQVARSGLSLGTRT